MLLVVVLLDDEPPLPQSVANSRRFSSRATLYLASSIFPSVCPACRSPQRTTYLGHDAAATFLLWGWYLQVYMQYPKVEILFYNPTLNTITLSLIYLVCFLALIILLVH
ncbi:hypothetical protein ILYODFUR_028807 [Ilyodon furcidens]|uniref:Uncharacterized protein n=1 Tax=Ilyodon furcidens TaxID=33524 RepID=A0ABV0VKH9_9TELE